MFLSLYLLSYPVSASHLGDGAIACPLAISGRDTSEMENNFHVPVWSLFLSACLCHATLREAPAHDASDAVRRMITGVTSDDCQHTPEN